MRESAIASEAERKFSSWGLLQEMIPETEGVAVELISSLRREPGKELADSVAAPDRLLPKYDVTAAKAATKRIADAAEMRRMVKSPQIDREDEPQHPVEAAPITPIQVECLEEVDGHTNA